MLEVRSDLHGTADARWLVVVRRGPLGTVYLCPFCSHHVLVPRGGPGSGRGYGLRTGGGAHSRVSAHIRAEHPDCLESA